MLGWGGAAVLPGEGSSSTKSRCGVSRHRSLYYGKFFFFIQGKTRLVRQGGGRGGKTDRNRGFRGINKNKKATILDKGDTFIWRYYTKINSDSLCDN